MIARMLTVKGPPGAANRESGVAAARVVRRFQRMQGFLGGIIMVDVEGSSVRTTGYWTDAEAVTASTERAATMGEAMARTLFGDEGTYELQVFDVIGIDPPPALAFPEL